MANDARAFTEMLTAQFQVYSREELLAAADSARGLDERRRTLLMTALGSSRTLDEAVHQRIQDAAQAPEPELRRAAVYAASYTPSVRSKPMPALLSSDDPDPGVREDAALMLEILTEIGTVGV
jgi:hypothetical protein